MVLYLLPLIQLIEKFPIWTVSGTGLLPAAGGCSEHAACFGPADCRAANLTPARSSRRAVLPMLVKAAMSYL